MVVFILVSILMFSFVVFANAEEDLIFMLGKNWELGYQGQDTRQMLKEFVIKGEKVENWSELVSLQQFPGLIQDPALDVFVETTEKMLKKNCPDVLFKIINKSKDEVLYEWHTSSCPGIEDQHELIRVMRGKEGLWALHYVTKKLPLSDAQRQEWLNILKTAHLTQPHSQKI